MYIEVVPLHAMEREYINHIAYFDCQQRPGASLCGRFAAGVPASRPIDNAGLEPCGEDFSDSLLQAAALETWKLHRAEMSMPSGSLRDRACRGTLNVPLDDVWRSFPKVVRATPVSWPAQVKGMLRQFARLQAAVVYGRHSRSRHWSPGASAHTDLTVAGGASLRSDCPAATTLSAAKAAAAHRDWPSCRHRSVRRLKNGLGDQAATVRRHVQSKSLSFDGASKVLTAISHPSDANTSAILHISIVNNSHDAARTPPEMAAAV